MPELRRLRLFRGPCVKEMKLVLVAETESELRLEILRILDKEKFKSYYWRWGPAQPDAEDRNPLLWEIDYGSHHDFFFIELPAD